MAISVLYANRVLGRFCRYEYDVDCPNCYNHLLRHTSLKLLQQLESWHVPLFCHHCHWRWEIDFSPEGASIPAADRTIARYQTPHDIAKPINHFSYLPFLAEILRPYGGYGQYFFYT